MNLNSRTIGATGLLLFAALLVGGCNGATTTPSTTKPEVAPPPSKKSGGDPPVAPTTPTGTTKDTGTLPSTDKPQPATVDMSRLAFKKKEGWSKEYNKFLKSWEVNKIATGRGGDIGFVHFYVDLLEANEPQNMDAFAEKLKEKDFLDASFVWKEITAKEKLSDGFYITGLKVDYKEKDAKPALVFVMVREIDGAKVKFHSSGAFNEANRTEAIELCKGAHFDPTK